MGEVITLFTFKINGMTFKFTINVVIQWVIIALITIVCIILTRNLKKVPGKTQTIAEMLVGGVNDLIKSNLGESYVGLAPYVGGLIIFLITMNFTGLVGIKAPTADYSVALGMALTTFIVIQWYAIKKVGLLHYFTAFAKPAPFLLPINIIERFLLPVSLSLRIFGNMTAGAVIVELMYSWLGSYGHLAQLGLPLIAHGYFDLFDGAIQMIVFMMLSIINLKVIAEH